LLHSRHNLESIVSPIKWGECKSEHFYDSASGTSNPINPIVGQEVSLQLDIIFNQEVDVTGLMVIVNFTA
jgi:hypothetical protein